MKNLSNVVFQAIGVVIGLSVAAAACSGDPENGSTTGNAGGAGGAGGASTASSTNGSTTASGSSSTGGDASTSASSSSGNPQDPTLSFFVTSTGNPTGNLGGLAGADKKCQDLAAAVGAGSKTWRAYLSVEQGADGQPEHAKDRIGKGPWYNAKLMMVAADLTELHARIGDHTVFLDENGEMVPGQWAGSPKPNQHDILTGSNKDGTVVPGKTCDDWTSEDATLFAWVGHSDGLGPMMSDAPQYRPWNSIHENGGCNDTTPKGGAGRIYCFAAD